MNKQYILIAICGEAGSGKDRVLKEVLKRDSKQIFNKVINHTTRPMREGEEHGKNYFYVSNEEFGAYVLDGTMIEATEFRGWFYGTCLEALAADKINIGVFNPAAIEILSEDPRIKLLVIRLLVPDNVRLIRQLSREENPDINEIIRRYRADAEDFSDFEIELFDFIELPNRDEEDLASAYTKIYNLGEHFGQ